MSNSSKSPFIRKSLRWCGLLVTGVLAALPLQAVEKSPARPAFSTNNIRSIVTEGNSVLIEVLAPAGAHQIVLQSQLSGAPGTWKPLAVQRNEGGERKFIFRVPKSKEKTAFRAMIQPVPLPSKFYKGPSSFPVAKGSSSAIAPMAGTLAAPVAADSSASAGSDPTTTSDTVTESDIWNVDGNRLYFFNQYRGLQVFDVSNPDSPVMLGALGVAASGEQMYLIDSNHVLLLTQDCSGSGQTQLAFVDVSDGIPTLLTNLPLSGYVGDTRLVGTSLYVAYSVLDETNGNYQYDTQISSFDFSKPSAPAAAATIVLPGGNNFLTASGNYLLAVDANLTNYDQADVACIDISAGKGAMTLLGAVQTAGQIEDQYSLSVSGNVLTAVSTDYTNAANGDAYYSYTDNVWVESFSLTNAPPVRVGALNLGVGSVNAARFESNRVYVSSADYWGNQPANIDIVDLSDPTNPIVAGQVVDPSAGQGFIFPLGNQLVTIGPDTNGQASVSLFDVTVATNASLLSQVALGTNYSWSEAEYNAQAFTLLPSIGLIMFPYQSYNYSGGSSSGIQLIDLNPTSIVLRGVVQQAQARRATFVNNRVLSASGTDLLTADISDQDNPVITSDLVLSWPVDQVFLFGNYVLEISTGINEQAQPVLTVASSASPNVALAQWTLTNSSILGATLQGNFLYLLQGPAPTRLLYGPILDPLPILDDESSVVTNGTTLTLSVVDLTNLPALSIEGETNFIVAQAPGAGVQAVWPQPNTLVWVASAQQEWFWPVLAGGGIESFGVAKPVGSVSLGSSEGSSSSSTISLASPPLPSPIVRARKSDSHKPAARKPTARKARPGAKPDDLVLPYFPWFYDSGGIQMYAFNVADPTNPALASSPTVGTNGWPNGNAVFATNGLVYVDHSVWGYFVVPLTANYGFNESSVLDVVDFTVPATPLVRNPVNICGALTGISRGGNVIYTVDYNGSLAALAYDGVSAYLIAELPANTNGFQETLVTDETIFTSESNYGENSTNALIAWTLADSGQFVQEGVLNLSQPVYALANFGNLLGLQAGSGIELVNFTDPTHLLRVGSGTPNGCVGLSLTGAGGALSAGLWVPLGVYGVFAILSQ